MFFLFWVLWIILNGKITVEIAVIGAVVSAAVYLFVCKFMDFSPQKDAKLCGRVGMFLWYLVILIVEILKANVAVMHFIISSKEEVEPQIITFQTDLKTKTARMILANSITLTPGTITVTLEENQYTVHCLDKSMSEGIEDSVFVKMLRKMEEGL
ncbi:MAG: Na+/H+ antiporter subunit E [Lachnospiraceae bacterium]|nr:Na+/H+ antiporter subunit E [Lachnospiraceae bacterium]